MSFGEEKSPFQPPGQAGLPPADEADLPRRNKLQAFSRLLARRNNDRSLANESAAAIAAELRSGEPAAPAAAGLMELGTRVLTLLPLSTELETGALGFYLKALPGLRKKGVNTLALQLPVRFRARLTTALEKGDLERVGVELALCGYLDLAASSFGRLLKEAHAANIEIVPVDRAGGYRAAFIAGCLLSLLRENEQRKILYLSLAPRLAEDKKLHAAVQLRLATLGGERLETALAVGSWSELSDSLERAAGCTTVPPAPHAELLLRTASAPASVDLACRRLINPTLAGLVVI